MSAKRITLQDIADEADVSLTAASLYINGKARRYNLAESTCARIQQVMDARNFTPNLHARAIASKKTFLVGVIISQQLESSFWLNIVSGLEVALAQADYHMLLSVSRNDPKLERQSIKFMRAKGVDGIIINPVSANLKELAEALPTVTLNRPVEGVPGVWNDNFTGGCKATEFLLENGHRNIAYIGGRGLFRFDAFSRLLQERGLPLNIFQSVPEFMARAGEFTAVFCSTDYILLELYQAAAAAGIKIPEQLSAVGYDNMDFLKFLNPAPATISQYKNELGSAAGELILKLINDPACEERETVFEPKLIPGHSVNRI